MSLFQCLKTYLTLLVYLVGIPVMKKATYTAHTNGKKWV